MVDKTMFVLRFRQRKNIRASLVILCKCHLKGLLPNNNTDVAFQFRKKYIAPVVSYIINPEDKIYFSPLSFFHTAYRNLFYRLNVI